MRPSFRKYVRTDIWREGKYLDLWSIPHFLSGVAVALAGHLIGFDVMPTFIIAFLLFVAYEMFEVMVKIEETRMNRILDVVVGMASFTPAYLLAPAFSDIQGVVAFWVVLGLDGVLSFFGWRASQKAAVLEAKLRAEFEAEMQKLRARRLARKQRRLQKHARYWRSVLQRGALQPDRKQSGAHLGST